MKKKYILFGGGVGLVALFGLVWMKNWKLLVSDFSWPLLLTTGDSFKESFPLNAQILMIAVSTLVGVYASLLLYYFRHKASWKALGVGLFGGSFSALGIGCTVCGSVGLSAIFGLAATSAVLAVLPFRGMEFSFVGIAVLVGAIYYLVREIKKPQFCPTPARGK